MLWFFITILAYLFLAIGSLVDRYILKGPLQDPGAYAFYVGILGLISMVLIPFGFYIPSFFTILLSFLAGAVWTISIYFLYFAVQKSEVSKIVPAIGGFLPIFTLIITYFAFSESYKIDSLKIFSLFLLILGSFLITFEKEKKSTLEDIKNSFLAALFFSIGFFLMKLAYDKQSFITGLILMRIGGALICPLFLFSKKTYKIIFKEKSNLKSKASLFVVLGQVFAGSGSLLQNYAVKIAAPFQIPFINALEGVRYVFLFLFVLVLNKKK